MVNIYFTGNAQNLLHFNEKNEEELEVNASLEKHFKIKILKIVRSIEESRIIKMGY